MPGRDLGADRANGAGKIDPDVTVGSESRAGPRSGAIELTGPSDINTRGCRTLRKIARLAHCASPEGRRIFPRMKAWRKPARCGPTATDTGEADRRRPDPPRSLAGACLSRLKSHDTARRYATVFSGGESIQDASLIPRA